MRRHRLAFTGGIAAAALAAAAVIVTAGSAQQPPTPTSLHLVTKTQKTVGFAPRARPRQGDRFGFGEAVTGDDSGFDRGVCTFIGRNQALCTVVLHLSKGTLTAGDLLTGGRANKAPFAITGGTGAYDGARGTALITDANSTTTDLQITLRP
jgi:hypothetical protein